MCVTNSDVKHNHTPIILILLLLLLNNTTSFLHAHAGAFMVHRCKDSAYGLTLIWACEAVHGHKYDQQSCRV